MKTDVAIIGAGPGGYVCAIRLAQLGKKVVLIEKAKLGGECLNYGCIPSKALIFASSLFDSVKKGNLFGLEVSDCRINLEKLQTFRANLVSKLNSGIAFLLKQNKVDVLNGEAEFIAPHKVSVSVISATAGIQKEEVEADFFVIATGSSAAQIPGFEVDGQRVIGSKEALELKTLPKELVVLGGGVIGLELGTYFSKLGSHVTVTEMMPHLLTGIPGDLVQVVERALTKRGVVIHKNAKAKRIEKGGLTFEEEGTEKTISCDQLLVTIGRCANTERLGLEKIGMVLKEKGFISVNELCQTSVPHIYAIGDVIGAPLLAHKASHEGLQVAETISHFEGAAKQSVATRGAARRISPPIPWAIFTDPEIAHVGLTEEEAKTRGEICIGKFPFSALGRALAVSETEGFVKVIADKRTEEVLGVSIVGAHASDLISEGALAVTHRLKLHDLSSTIHPHPTLPEALMEAAEVAQGRAIHIVGRPSS